MKSYKLISFLIFLLSCEGISLGLAMEGERVAPQPKVGNELHTSSPTTPNSRYMNVEGMLKDIQGDLYILEVASADHPIQVKVGKDTAFPNGPKEPGQSVQALLSAQDGHALIIR